MDKNLSESIAAILQYGEGAAVSRSALAWMLNEHERTIRKSIEHLRRSGTVIASSDKGYFYPETAVELIAYIRREESRARQTDSVLTSARELLRQMLPERCQNGAPYHTA